MGAPPNLNIPIQGNTNIINSVIDVRYTEGFGQAKPWIGEIADEVMYTRGATVIMSWTEEAKRFREFDGEFRLDPWIVDAIQTTAKPWQSNIGVDRYEQIENVYMSIISQAKTLGRQAALLPCDWASLALRTNGSSSSRPFLWYDGLPAFSETHPVDPRGVIGGTWRNLYKGLPFTHQNIIDVYQSMCVGVVLPNGRQVNVRPTKLGVSGKYIIQAKKFCESDLIVSAIQSSVIPGQQAFGAERNPIQGMLAPVVMNELTQTIRDVPGEPDVWYMWDDSVVKPLTVYWILKPYVTPIVSDTDGLVRTTNTYMYLAEAHGVCVVKAPWYIARIEPGIGP